MATAALALLPFTLEVVTGFQVATYPAGASFGPRQLRNYEFVWMMEGNALYQRRTNGVWQEAPEGSIVLCCPGATDAFRWDPDRRTRHAYFHFELRGSLPTDWPSVKQWPDVRIPAREGDLLRSIFGHLAAWGPSGGDSTQVQGLTATLLAAFVTGEYLPPEVALDTEAATPVPEPVVRALDYLTKRLDENPADKLPLSELASAAFVRPEYLCRLFKAHTGRSPMETIRLARLERAASLLARTNYGVAEVAHLCGFESPFHFSRAFRDVYGKSPRAYREEAR